MASVGTKRVILIFSLLLDRSFQFLLDSSNNQISRCPNTVKHDVYLRTYRDKCYEFVIYQLKYWSDARTDCQHKGGDLVIIPDAGTQNYVMTSLQELRNPHDGEPLKGYSNWANKQGGANFLHLTQDCAQIRINDHGLWHDRECHLWPNTAAYICEFDMLPLPSTTPTVTTKLPTRQTVTTKLPTTLTVTTKLPTTQTVTTKLPTTQTVTTKLPTTQTVTTKLPTTERYTTPLATTTKSTIPSTQFLTMTSAVTSLMVETSTTGKSTFPEETTVSVTNLTMGNNEERNILTTGSVESITTDSTQTSSKLFAVLSTNQIKTESALTTNGNSGIKLTYGLENKAATTLEIPEVSHFKSTRISTKINTPSVSNAIFSQSNTDTLTGSLEQHSTSFSILSTKLPVSTERTTVKIVCSTVDCSKTCPFGYSGIFVGADGCVECLCL